MVILLTQWYMGGLSLDEVSATTRARISETANTITITGNTPPINSRPTADKKMTILANNNYDVNLMSKIAHDACSNHNQ